MSSEVFTECKRCHKNKTIDKYSMGCDICDTCVDKVLHDITT